MEKPLFRRWPHISVIYAMTNNYECHPHAWPVREAPPRSVTFIATLPLCVQRGCLSSFQECSTVHIDYRAITSTLWPTERTRVACSNGGILHRGGGGAGWPPRVHCAATPLNGDNARRRLMTGNDSVPRWPRPLERFTVGAKWWWVNSKHGNASFENECATKTN